MTPAAALTALRRVPVDDLTAATLGFKAGELRLLRAWPRGAAHLLLDLQTPSGGRLPGQWFGAPAVLAQRERQTRAAAASPVDVASVGGHGVLLQLRGADRRLRALPTLLRRPGAALVVHRPERRAVVRLTAASGGAATYAKVVRSAAAATAGAQAAAVVPLRTPKLLGVEERVLRWSQLPGVPLHTVLAETGTISRLPAVGRAVRALHDTVPPPGARLHDATAEVGVIDAWLARTSPYDPGLVRSLEPTRDTVAARLGAGRGPLALVHRDLHDKQLLLDGDDVGLLDFDLLAAGEAALDLANLLVHLELRSLQGSISTERARLLAEALLEGYAPGPAVLARLCAYAAAARLRLCLVYRFRPGSGSCIEALRLRLLSPPLGLRPRGSLVGVP